MVSGQSPRAVPEIIALDIHRHFRLLQQRKTATQSNNGTHSMFGMDLFQAWEENFIWRGGREKIQLLDVVDNRVFPRMRQWPLLDTAHHCNTAHGADPRWPRQSLITLGRLLAMLCSVNCCVIEKCGFDYTDPPLRYLPSDALSRDTCSAKELRKPLVLHL